jgi:hypothetical protein
LADCAEQSVVHSLVQLESELQPSNPAKGKGAAFVGEGIGRRGGDISLLVFPRVKYKSVVDYHKVQEELLPEVAAMRDEDPADNGDTKLQVRHLVPIPTKLVPLFIDSPSIATAIARLSSLVDDLPTQMELDHYAPFIATLTTAACAHKSGSIISTVAIATEKIVYKGQVKTFAESLWRRQQELNNDKDESQDKQNGPPEMDGGADYSPSKSKEGTNGGEDSEPDEDHGNGAKSQKPNAVTPPT